MNTILLFIIAFLLLFVAPIVLSFKLKNNQKALKITAIIFACFYFIALFIGTTCEIDIDIYKTTISFDYTKNWFDINFLIYDFDFDNILINLSMFFPLGFIVYVFFEKNPFFKTLIFSICLSLFIELYQFILPISRFTELTDLVFNFLSGLISAYVCKFLIKKGAFKNKSQSINQNKQI